jgi:hypothetical protein
MTGPSLRVTGVMIAASTLIFTALVATCVGLDRLFLQEKETITARVTDKCIEETISVVHPRRGSSYTNILRDYRIETDHGVMYNEAAIYDGQNIEGMLYDSLKIGKSYQLNVLRAKSSGFRNIIGFKHVKKDTLAAPKL